MSDNSTDNQAKPAKADPGRRQTELMLWIGLPVLALLIVSLIYMVTTENRGVELGWERELTIAGASLIWLAIAARLAWRKSLKGRPAASPGQPAKAATGKFIVWLLILGILMPLSAAAVIFGVIFMIFLIQCANDPKCI